MTKDSDAPRPQNRNLKFSILAYPDEIAFVEEIATRLGIEKSNLFRRGLKKYLQEELHIEVPPDLLNDRSKGNPNPPTEQLKGSRWKDHIPKKHKTKVSGALSPSKANSTPFSEQLGTQ